MKIILYSDGSYLTDRDRPADRYDVNKHTSPDDVSNWVPEDEYNPFFGSAEEAREAQRADEELFRRLSDAADKRAKRYLPPRNKAARLRLPHDPFIWCTHKGECMAPANMATKHLFYTVRMLFNNVVAPVFRVGKFKRYGDVEKWDLDYLTQASLELTTELLKRTDLEKITNGGGEVVDMPAELQDIFKNALVIEQLSKI